MINCPALEAVFRFSVLPPPAFTCRQTSLSSGSRWIQSRPSSTRPPSTARRQIWRKAWGTCPVLKVCWLWTASTAMAVGRICPSCPCGRRHVSRSPARSRRRGSSASRPVTAGWTRSCPCLSCTRSGWENTTGWPHAWHDSTLTGGQRSSIRRRARSSGRCIRWHTPLHCNNQLKLDETNEKTYRNILKKSYNVFECWN